MPVPRPPVPTGWWTAVPEDTGTNSSLDDKPDRRYPEGASGGHIGRPAVNDGAAVTTGEALVIDIFLVALFGLQHSVMARPKFKRAWTKLVTDMSKSLLEWAERRT